jgi:hypothetical protein
MKFTLVTPAMEKPNEVELLKTYSLIYGYSFEFNKTSLIPLVGLITGKEKYRGEIIDSHSYSGFLGSGTYYDYDYSQSNYYGIRIGVELLIKYSKHVGFSFEPCINDYKIKRPDVGLSFNMVLGKLN